MTDILHKSIARRVPLLGEDTNALRIFDGMGDGLSGLSIDAYADSWVVATQGERIHPEFLKLLEKSGKSVYWKRLSQTQKESPEHLFGPEVNESFLARENGLNYEICYQAGYSQGIFLDQRENRKKVIERVSSGDSVLNTFAYTGAFSVCAASSGATATTLDLSQPYLDWGKRNFEHNNLDPSEHFWCKGDTFHWLDRFAKKGRKFDGIILDPPTFSRDAKGKVFRVEKDYTRLVELAASCLNKGGWMLASTNCRKLNDHEFLTMVKKGFDVPNKAASHTMPEEYRDVPFLKTVWVEV